MNFLRQTTTVLGTVRETRWALVPSPESDAPRKAWVLDIPPPGMSLEAWKKLRELNNILAQRMAGKLWHQEEQVQLDHARFYLEAARRLSL